MTPEELLGARVRKVMGVRLAGAVTPRIPCWECSDGTYRDPGPRESAVYVRWDDGTVGWVHRQFLQPEARP